MTMGEASGAVPLPAPPPDGYRTTVAERRGEDLPGGYGRYGEALEIVVKRYVRWKRSVVAHGDMDCASWSAIDGEVA